MAKDKVIRANAGGLYFKKILFFALPLMLTGVLQSLYNAADLVIVGRFEGERALAAVGSTGSLTNLILGLFMGLSVGAGVCVAHGIGAKNDRDVQSVLHTSVLLSLILGAAVGIVGFIFAPELLHIMDTPDNVIELASVYVKIIFIGAPASILYNYCAAMLRAAGDSKHPLIFLTVSGIINVLLNIILVAGFRLGVSGVAIATSVSQYVSALLILRHLHRAQGALNFSFRKLKIHKDKIGKILVIGIPSGIQGTLFSFSNVIIQSSINSFGSAVMAGSSASANIESFFYVAYHAFYDTTLTFVGQCVGARKFRRIKRIVFASVLNILMFAVLLFIIAVVFRDPLLGLYLPDNPDAMEAAVMRYSMIVLPYFLCGFMEIGSGTLRAMGRSISSAVITLVFACLLRVVWISTVFKTNPTPEYIYITYPISWILTSIILFIFVFFAVKKEIRLKNMYEGSNQMPIEK